MNIVDWVSGKTKHAESAIKAVEHELNGVDAKLSSMDAEAQKLSDLRKSLKEQSLSFADVEAKLGTIAKTRQPIEEAKRNLTEKHTAAKEAYLALDPLRKFSNFCEIKIGQVEVTEIESVRDLLKHVSVAVRFDANIAIACELWWGEVGKAKESLAELEIRSKAKRGRPNLMPEELEWVPESWLPATGCSNQSRDGDRQILRSTEDESQHEIYFMRSEQKVRSLIGKVSFSVEKRHEVQVRNQWGQMQTQWQAYQDRDSVPFEMEEQSLLVELFGIFEDSYLDLDEKDEDPFLEEIADLVRKATTPVTESPYKPSQVAQTTSDISKIIGPDFKKFVEAPWTPATDGIVANLKYYCEQGERPRFYNLNLEGLYGFRLRTRDHSWILGELYLVPKSLPYSGSPTEVPEIISSHRRVLARIDRLLIMVQAKDAR